MPIITCKKCGNPFYAKPFHIKKGYGIFCSRNCSYESMKNGKYVTCFTCEKSIYKTALQITRAKSKKYFCDKSCQTRWRNKEFSGEKHKNWAGGFSVFRDILIRSNVSAICAKCGVQDLRVLAVHHIDRNHKNNKKENLQWLCHNCHHLIHHGNVGK